jgi:hypothetical protein
MKVNGALQIRSLTSAVPRNWRNEAPRKVTPRWPLLLADEQRCVKITQSRLPQFNPAAIPFRGQFEKSGEKV